MVSLVLNQHHLTHPGEQHQFQPHGDAVLNPSIDVLRFDGVALVVVKGKVTDFVTNNNHRAMMGQKRNVVWHRNRGDGSKFSSCIQRRPLHGSAAFGPCDACGRFVHDHMLDFGVRPDQRNDATRGHHGRCLLNPLKRTRLR